MIIVELNRTIGDSLFCPFIGGPVLMERNLSR